MKEAAQPPPAAARQQPGGSAQRQQPGGAPHGRSPWRPQPIAAARPGPSPGPPPGHRHRHSLIQTAAAPRSPPPAPGKARRGSPGLPPADIPRGRHLPSPSRVASTCSGPAGRAQPPGPPPQLSELRAGQQQGVGASRTPGTSQRSAAKLPSSRFLELSFPSLLSNNSSFIGNLTFIFFFSFRPFTLQALKLRQQHRVQQRYKKRPPN